MKLKSTITAAVAALTMGAGLVASTSSAEAQWRRGGYGPGIALGVGAGLLGAGIIASQRPYYGGGYGGGYYAPAYAAPVYGAPAYGAGCWRERRAVHDNWGNFRGYRMIRVCG